VEGALYGTEQDIRIDQNAQLAAIRTQAGTADSLIGDGRGSILKLVSGESTPLFVSGTCNFGIFLSNYVKVEAERTNVECVLDAKPRMSAVPADGDCSTL